MSSTTANMGLTVPSVGDSDYPTSVSSLSTSVDAHDHTSGKGVQVPTGGIADLAVTTAKLAATSVTNAKLGLLSVDAGVLAANAVTTAKILDANVTRAKLAAVGQQLSSSSGSFSTGSGTYVDVTNLTVTITTTGRPVFLGIIADGSTSDSYYEVNLSGSSGDMYLKIIRDSTDIAFIRPHSYSSAGSGFVARHMLGQIHVDVVAAGTYTYKIQIKGDGASTAKVFNAKLLAYEL